jgi:hypothetical protein
MFYLDQQTRKRYRIGTPFVYDGITYTSTGASHNTFMSLGFQQVIPAPRPDDRFYIVNSPCNPDGSWSYSERDLADVQTGFCDQQVTAANGNLKATDYLYARAAESTRSADEAVTAPAALLTQRDEVRAYCAANCALIMGTKSIEELEKLIKAPAEIVEDLEAEEPVIIPNPEPHLEMLPTFDEREYLKSTFMAPATADNKKAKR